jgi:hypothetical protein
MTRLAAPLLLLGALWLGGCASTSVTLTPSPQPPVCHRTATALLLWAPQWRADQKDVPQREQAAAEGLRRFTEGTRCFARTEPLRIDDLSPDTITAHRIAAARRVDRVVVIAVRELGPVVKLLGSAALVEGGTEVVLDIAVHDGFGVLPSREFGVRWQNGGPGVIKGVASLPDDMRAALVAALKPDTASP